LTDNDLSLLRTQILELTKIYADNLFKPKAFVAGSDPVPVSGKVLTADDLSALVDSSLEGWLTAGRFSTAFERKLSQFVGVQVRTFWL
jgi:CDP-4-dehydro-6-deoxyglucose reductase, E1